MGGLRAFIGGLSRFIPITAPLILCGDAPCNQSVNKADKGSHDKDGNDKRRESKPRNVPKGTKPIDQSGLGRGKIHDIKDGIGAGPKDWVGVTPAGGIITTDPETGEAVDEGHVNDY